MSAKPKRESAWQALKQEIRTTSLITYNFIQYIARVSRQATEIQLRSSKAGPSTWPRPLNFDATSASCNLLDNDKSSL